MNPRRPGSTNRDPLCRMCGYRTSLLPNPHYGVGLAVHRYLRVCGRCDWVAIVSELPVLPAAVPVEVEGEDLKKARALRGLRRRWRKTA